MTGSEEFGGANLDLALELAAQRVGRRKEELTYSVVSEERGFLGVGTKAVVIRVDLAARPAPRLPRATAGPARTPVVPPAPSAAAPDDEGMDADADPAEESVEMGPDPTSPLVGDMVTQLLTAAGFDLQAVMSEEPEKILVNLSGPDRELLLGPKAEVLDAMQYLVNRMARKKLGTLKRIQLESDGFRSDREEEIREMAIEVAERVRRTGEPVRLPPLNPYERRIVHVALSRGQGVNTESEGDGFVKRVMVKPAGGAAGGGRRSRDGYRGGRGR